MLPMIPLRLNGFLYKYQRYVLYQNEISLEKHRMLGMFQFFIAVTNILKYPYMIKERHCKAL